MCILHPMMLSISSGLLSCSFSGHKSVNEGEVCSGGGEHKN